MFLMKLLLIALLLSTTACGFKSAVSVNDQPDANRISMHEQEPEIITARETTGEQSKELAPIPLDLASSTTVQTEPALIVSSVWVEQGWQQLDDNNINNALAIWQAGVNSLPSDQLLAMLGVFSNLPGAIIRLKTAGQGEKAIILQSVFKGKKAFYVMSVQHVPADKSTRRKKLASLYKAIDASETIYANEAKKFQTGKVALTTNEGRKIVPTAKEHQEAALTVKKRRESALAHVIRKATLTVNKAQKATLAANEPEKEATYRFSVGVVKPGDVIEIRFYRNALLQMSAYKVGSCDVLKVNVYGHQDLSQERVLVLPDGHISVPLVNRYLVAGKDVDAISKGLAEILKDKKIRTPQVTVSVMESDQRLTTLLGTLNQNANTGLRILVDETGYLNLPFIGPIRTLRPLPDIQKEVQNAYQKIFAGQLEVAVNLTEGAVENVYVLGEVSRPGEVEYSSHLNPVMAISAAGGFLPTADQTSVRLVRYLPSGANKQWELNLKDPADKRQQYRPYIQVFPHDVLYVPKSGVAVANQFVDQYIRKMLPIGFSAGIVLPVFGR